MLVDLSHVIEDGMITYRGLPAPLMCDFLSREKSRTIYAEGTEFCIGKIEMVANTALVDSLEQGEVSIRWDAAEALIKIDPERAIKLKCDRLLGELREEATRIGTPRPN